MSELASKPRRRWFRFSLRTMLLVAVAITVPLGLGLHKVREQGRAVAALKKLGCSTMSHRFYLIVNGSPDAAPTLLERLRGLLGEDEPRTVTNLFGDGSQVNDDSMGHLRVLTQLASLSLNHTQVTDAGLANLAGLTQLQNLSLTDTRVTDAGLVHLRGLTHLRELNLQGTRVTDEKLRELGKFMPSVVIRY